jgi:hypothetical protein
VPAIAALVGEEHAPIDGDGDGIDLARKARADVDEDMARAEFTRELQELLRGIERRHFDQHRADAHEREREYQMIGAVPHGNSDVGACRDAGALQIDSRLADENGKIAIGDRASRFDDRRDVGSLGRVMEDRVGGICPGRIHSLSRG